MRDATHMQHVVRWAKRVRALPRSEWVAELKPFLDSQVIMANRFYEKLARREGRRKVARLVAAR